MVLTELFVALFVAVFLLHEIEEVLVVRRWMTCHATTLQKRFPRMQSLLAVLSRVRTLPFIVAVAEETLIVVVCTAVALCGGGFVAWWCCVAAYALHVVVHCVQAFAVGGYVPGLVTSLVSLPYCVVAVMAVAGLFPIRNLVLWGLLGAVLTAANLYMMHSVIARMSEP